MASSAALTAEAYLDELDEATRAELLAVRSAVRASVPTGIVEGMEYGMITWSVPFSVYADTSNGRPLAYAGLAAQKRYNSLYLLAACSCVDGRVDADAIARRWSGGKPLKMGKSCIRSMNSSHSAPEHARHAAICDVSARGAPSPLRNLTR